MYDQIASNRRRSAVLTFAFILIVGLVGWAFAQVVGFGPWGVVFAVAVSVGGAFLSYWKSDKIALAMSHARVADPTEYARFHNLVEGLCIASGLPKPRLYVVEDDAPNAFATGRNPKNAAIAVTTGLLAKMNRVELEAVIAHELGHVKNYDILVSTLAVTMVGVVTLLADIGMRFMYWGGPRHRDDRNSDNSGGVMAVLAVVGFVLLLVSPLIAKLMQFAISRKREELADVTGVAMTRYPPGLISALEKLRDDKTVVHSSSRATAHLWIESPIGREAGEMLHRGEGSRTAWLNRLFTTHPPIDDRIAALREL
jgi:heat shock protein HtpX